MDIAHIDLRKEFSEICHDILINKIVKYGLEDTTIRWSYNWLNDPTQRVLVFESTSAWRVVLSGASDGSIPGPVLFDIFTNDPDEEIERINNK